MSSKGHLMVNDENKKMKRMISNRESARRSRMKKEKHMKDLNDQIFYFSKKKQEMVLNIERITTGHAATEMDNMVLRSQKQELEKRLEYAKSVCSRYGDVVQEPWVRPWEPSNSMRVMSSAGFSNF
ncbi:bZIP transcription factor 11-like [Cynara cardunculus var. scolymus]|uniref:Basic-leucine zipper domain-containing protein n=1 Tax=Cynara cardunculus var. scolymus TaxID=59895 RepID=A0A118JZN9_CYNCS|nr:bZIP transcription factor 11-like [Cynara cardunculus var. scolymus]KVH99852.1 Basic-leucine zipper domain-containing protein [Cynara cardunculus var. scolymus]